MLPLLDINTKQFVSPCIACFTYRIYMHKFLRDIYFANAPLVRIFREPALICKICKIYILRNIYSK